MDWRRLSLLRVVGDRSQGISRLKLSLMESVTTNTHYCCPTGKCSNTVSDKVLSLSSRLCQSKEATLRCTNRSKSKSFWMRRKKSAKLANASAFGLTLVFFSSRNFYFWIDSQFLDI